MGMTSKKATMCLKSWMTLLLTACLCILTVLNPDEYMETFKTIITMVATFYFAHQTEKGGDGSEAK